MATIGNSFPSLIDHYRSVDKYGDYIPVIEALTVLNPLMQDAYVFEANEGTQHKSAIRTGLPTPTWGKLYQGIPQSKSTKQQVTDTSGFVESLSTVDTRLLNYKKNPAQARADEAAAHMEGIAQDVQTNFFYSDTATTPERFKGLAARYDTLANTQVVNGAGSGSDNTSIWMVTWGRGKTGLFYPEGSKGGIIRDDKGEQRTLDASSNPYYVKEEYFRQDVGVTVGDWRYNVRIANIDVSDMNAGSVDLYSLLQKGLYKMQGTFATDINNGAQLSNPFLSGGKTVIYMNRTVLQAIDSQTTNDSKLQLHPAELEGKMVKMYRGLPIHVTDAILNTEAALS